MSQPSVNITELDGAIGSLPAGQKRIAVVGVASAGPFATPAAFSRTSSIVSNFTRGPMPELAAFWVNVYKAPAICVRTAQSTVATKDAIVVTGVTGTSVVTATGATLADDDVEALFKVVTGGTIGVAGITYQWSLDGGRTMSPVTALGTATAFVFPNSGGLGFSFAAGTLVAGDTVTQRAYAANFSAADLGVALEALRVSTYDWDLCVIVGPVDSTIFDAIATARAANPEKTFICAARTPTAAETEATYKTALDTIFGAKADNGIIVCAGACEQTSSISFRSYRRPSLFAIAPRLGSVSEEIDIAQPTLGALPSCNIRDTNGNPKHHDESVNPGLDDSRFSCLRTIDGKQGVYVNNCRILSATGSDFEFAQHRRIYNIARRTLRLYFTDRLSSPILVDAATGFILESEALEIEAGADAAMRTALRAKPKCSGGGIDGKASRFCKLSRTDNILSSKTLTVQGAVIPLAYPKNINIDLGFKNPAVQAVTAA
jgi:hypothetical protein